jgi:hypothetical protein
MSLFPPLVSLCLSVSASSNSAWVDPVTNADVAGWHHIRLQDNPVPEYAGFGYIPAVNTVVVTDAYDQAYVVSRFTNTLISVALDSQGFHTTRAE